MDKVKSSYLTKMTHARHTFTDAQWQRIEPSMPLCKGRPGGAHRPFFDALLWMARTGAPWPDLPDLPERLGTLEQGVPALCVLVQKRLF